MTASSTSVWIARLGLLGCVYYDFMISMGMVVDAKVGTGRKNMFSC
jgi:hypothetical protein